MKKFGIHFWHGELKAGTADDVDFRMYDIKPRVRFIAHCAKCVVDRERREGREIKGPITSVVLECPKHGCVNYPYRASAIAIKGWKASAKEE